MVFHMWMLFLVLRSELPLLNCLNRLLLIGCRILLLFQIVSRVICSIIVMLTWLGICESVLPPHDAFKLTLALSARFIACGSLCSVATDHLLTSHSFLYFMLKQYCYKIFFFLTIGDPRGMWSGSYPNTRVNKQSFWINFRIWISKYCIWGGYILHPPCLPTNVDCFLLLFHGAALPELYGTLREIADELSFAMAGHEEWLYCNCNYVSILMIIILSGMLHIHLLSYHWYPLSMRCIVP